MSDRLKSIAAVAGGVLLFLAVLYMMFGVWGTVIILALLGWIGYWFHRRFNPPH